ncbi:hypothetical protein [Runella sp.]|uniref:hypothetical protein n=1 Tax=Runella sp. TaxID=1960881 RepID=UPI00262847E6|nr:hypothetical protein [Runella sp.]
MKKPTHHRLFSLGEFRALPVHNSSYIPAIRLLTCLRFSKLTIQNKKGRSQRPRPFRITVTEYFFKKIKANFNAVGWGHTTWHKKG